MLRGCDGRAGAAACCACCSLGRGPSQDERQKLRAWRNPITTGIVVVGVVAWAPRPSTRFFSFSLPNREDEPVVLVVRTPPAPTVGSGLDGRILRLRDNLTYHRRIMTARYIFLWQVRRKDRGQGASGVLERVRRSRERSQLGGGAAAPPGGGATAAPSARPCCGHGCRGCRGRRRWQRPVWRRSYGGAVKATSGLWL